MLVSICIFSLSINEKPLQKGQVSPVARLAAFVVPTAFNTIYRTAAIIAVLLNWFPFASKWKTVLVPAFCGSLVLEIDNWHLEYAHYQRTTGNGFDTAFLYIYFETECYNQFFKNFYSQCYIPCCVDLNYRHLQKLQPSTSNANIKVTKHSLVYCCNGFLRARFPQKHTKTW